MKHLNKILFGTVVCVSVLAAVSCSTETEFIYPEQGISRLTVSPRSVEMGFADEVSFTVAVRPGDTKYVWESSDASVAYVDENDRIVPVGTGAVTFTCSAGDFVQTVEAVIRPSVVVSRDYVYIDAGQSSSMDFVKVLPEGTAFMVTSADEEVVSVPDDAKLGFDAVAAGVAEVTVTAGEENPVTGKFTVAVAGTDKVITATAADEYFYGGAVLGHPVYGVSALALKASGVEYADGGEWSGAGTGLFLKLYNPSRGTEYAAVPAGKYTAGESEYSFYTDNSYIIDAETGTKTNITEGELEISDNGVSGYITAGSDIYKVEYTGARTGKEHVYTYDSVTYDYTGADFTTDSYLCIDHNGTVYYGGITNVWVWYLKLSGDDYLQLVFRTEDTDDPQGTFPVVDSYFSPATCVAMGWGTSTKIKVGGVESYISSGTVSVLNYVYDATYPKADLKGTFYGTCADSIVEIGESRNIPFTVNLNAEAYSPYLYEY